MKNKNALIVTPYLDHLGGGERYMLEAASVIESAGYQVFFAWDNLTQISKLTKLLGITLSAPRVDPGVLPKYFGDNPLSMWRATRPYELVLYLSDGSLPMLGGKKNLIHMQVPFQGVAGKSLKNRLKKQFIHRVIVNSRFTKATIDREFGIDSTVIYPPVNAFQSGKKDKLILSVGRFEPSLNVKQQDKLIDAFKLLSTNLPGWQLVLVGGSNSPQYLRELRQYAHGLPVSILANISYKELVKYYQRATIYWHAAGLGVNEKVNPELTEHFGITTAEAIMAGAVPLVVPKGGQREVVPQTAFYWQTIPELVSLTKTVLKDPSRYRQLAKELPIQQFSLHNFQQSIKSLIK